MSSVPNSWKKYKLYELCDFMKGGGLSKSKIVDNGMYQCILYGELFTTYLEEINLIQSQTNAQEGILSRIGDVLVPASTTTSAIDLAIASVLDHNNVLLGGDINILRKKTDLYDPYFLAILLRYYEKIKLSQFAQGSTIIHLYGRDFNTLEICIPDDITEQEIISHIIRSINNLLAITNTQIEKLIRVKQGLLQDLLARGIDENGELRDPATHKFKLSPLGMIPEEWIYSSLDSFLTQKIYGISSSLKDIGEIPVLRMNNIENGEISFSDLKYASYIATRDHLLIPGDVLFNRTNSAKLVGKTAIFRGKPNSISYASYLVNLRTVKRKLKPEFLNFLMNEPGTVRRIKQLGTLGVSQVNINPTNLGKTIISCPKLIEEQNLIIEYLIVIDKSISSIKKNREKILSLKTGLMQDLLSGKVSVVQLLEQGG